MAVKIPKPQPAIREKTCQVCGESYTYPEAGSLATRFHCELCVGLSEHSKKVLGRMAKRITSLEKSIDKLKKEKSNPVTS
ncbi:MAG TPA: hypothetical protein VK995_06805 [Oceanipulchritudo sp.]|nr:hypothetical protein [Oceanipulchritudo sp.]